MNEAKVVWRRRVASAAALVNLAYVLITVYRLADAIALTVGSINATPAGWERMLMVFMVGGVVILLVVGLAIASPLLTWLIVLAVGLWRGRRWARVGGMITFTLVTVVIVALAVGTGADVGGYVRAVLFLWPAVVGLVVLARSPSAFAATPVAQLPPALSHGGITSSSADAPSVD